MCEVETVLKKEEIEEFYQKIKIKDSSTHWQFGHNPGWNKFFYRIGKYEFIQHNIEATEYICIRTPESEMDLDNKRKYTTSLHPKDVRKTKAYYTKWDQASREAKKHQN